MIHNECTAAQEFMYNIDPDVGDFVDGNYADSVDALKLLKEEAEFEFADTREFEESLNLLQGVTEQRKKELIPLFLDMDEEMMFKALESLNFNPETEELLHTLQIHDALEIGTQASVQHLQDGYSIDESIEKGMISAAQAFIFASLSPRERAEWLADMMVWGEFETAFQNRLPKDSVYHEAFLSWHHFRSPKRPKAPWAAFIVDSQFAEADVAAVARVYVEDKTGSISTSLSIEPVTLLEKDKRKFVEELNGVSAVQIGCELVTAFSNAIMDLNATTWSSAYTEQQRLIDEKTETYISKLIGLTDLPDEERVQFEEETNARLKYSDIIENSAHYRDWGTTKAFEVACFILGPDNEDEEL
jgi:hypothetical protein